MRRSIQISALAGVLFLALRFIGLFIHLSYENLFLYLGVGILLFITLPLYLLERHRYNDMKKRIISDFKNAPAKTEKKNSEKSDTPEYPAFRQQKSGLTWGGGNIHAANAKRGSRRGFLKH